MPGGQCLPSRCIDSLTQPRATILEDADLFSYLGVALATALQLTRDLNAISDWDDDAWMPANIYSTNRGR